MKRLFGFGIGICLLTASASSVSAQIRRLKGPVDPVEMTRFAGHETPAALLQDDLGRVDANREIHGIMILFSQTPEQEADLAALLKAQQDPASPAYHQWLTPAQYGDRFGLNPADLAPIRDFYESQGLSVEQTATARNWLLLGGRVGDINRAFRIELHDFRTADGTHYANAASPSVPTTLTGIIRSIQGLNDFRPRAPHREFRARPSVLLSNGSHALTPFDWAMIYNVTPLYANGYDGSGQSIAVVGQSDIILSDIQGFRAQFGLPAARVQKVLGGPFPAQSSDDQGESTLDVEWAGGVARNATIYFVYSANINISRAFAVDQNVAPVISDSYLYCEPAVTVNPSANDYRLTALQANSQGITWLAASGDSGAAACDKQFANPVANYGIAVNLPASVPEVTAVGGTMFLEGNQYWNSSGTALTYIPETAWNEVGGGLASSGGGRSIFFTKPDWQTGTGVPNDGRRDVPDVAFSAAASDVPYVIVLNGQYEYVGGTSAGTPSFAGSVAILNQYLVSKGAVARAGLGTINPTLYRLSQTNPNVFHDITTGSNIIPCNIYSPYCSAPTIGYLATRGYDLATGLGSVDINAMVSNWAPQATGTTTTLSANPTSILNTAATLLTAAVRAVSGTATPSGTVTFQVSGRALGSVTLSGSAGVATAVLNVNGSSFSVGSSVITAVYNGATGFGASANTVTLTVTVPTAVSLVTATATPNPVYQQPANSGGYTFFYTLKLIESAGVGTTLTSFSVNGTSYNAQIAQFFGTASLAARGSLSSSIQSYGFTVPGNVAFVFGGQDPGGRAWTSTLSVPFSLRRSPGR